MANRLTVPFPGILNEKERANLSAVAFNNPKSYIYFEIKGNRQFKGIEIATLPINSLLTGFIYARIVETFNGILPTLLLGTYGDEDSIGTVPLSSLGARQVYPDGFLNFLNIFTEKTAIIGSIVANTGSTITTGRAWAILEYLELDKIKQKVIGE